MLASVDARPFVLKSVLALLLAGVLAQPVAAQCESGRKPYTLKNYSTRSVTYTFSTEGDETTRTLEPGDARQTCTIFDEAELRIDGRSGYWALEPGGHHIWWDEEDDRFEVDIDSDYYLGHRMTERDYTFENRTGRSITFYVDGDRVRLREGQQLDQTREDWWVPRISFRANGRMRRYRASSRCMYFFWMRSQDRVGFTEC